MSIFVLNIKISTFSVSPERDMKRVQMKDAAISAQPRAAHVKNDTDNKWASLFKR